MTFYDLLINKNTSNKSVHDVFQCGDTSVGVMMAFVLLKCYNLSLL